MDSHKPDHNKSHRAPHRERDLMTVQEACLALEHLADGEERIMDCFINHCVLEVGVGGTSAYSRARWLSQLNTILFDMM